MATAIGQIDLIGIDSERGDVACFSLVQEMGALKLADGAGKQAWFCIDLRQNERMPGRALLQEAYRAQRSAGTVVVSYDGSRCTLEMLANCCYQVQSIQLLSSA